MTCGQCAGSPPQLPAPQDGVGRPLRSQFTAHNSAHSFAFGFPLL